MTTNGPSRGPWRDWSLAFSSVGQKAISSRARSVHLNDDAIAQRDALLRLAFNQLTQHRHCFEQT